MLLSAVAMQFVIEADDQIIVIGRMGSIATRVGIISHGIRSPPDEPTVPM